MKLFQCMMVDLTTMSGEQKFVQVEDNWTPNDLMIKYIDPSSEDFEEDLEFFSEQEILNLDETGFTLDFEDSVLIFEDFGLIDPQINKILEKLVSGDHSLTS